MTPTTEQATAEDRKWFGCRCLFRRTCNRRSSVRSDLQMDRPGGWSGRRSPRPDTATLPVATSLSMAVSMNGSQDMPQMTVLTAVGPVCDAVDSGVGANQRT